MRLVVVSNRAEAPSKANVCAGGMTVGIVGALKEHGGLWLGWSGQLVDGTSVCRRRSVVGKVEYVTLDLPRVDFQGYYAGFANQVLWPLFHDRPDLVTYSRPAYNSYLAINRLFADELARVLRPDDVVWVHDYHLIPLGHLLRERGVPNRIGFFLHTPFAKPDELRQVPVSGNIAEFFCAYDLVGLQTRADVEAFREFLAERPFNNRSGALRYAPVPLSDVFPIGIDTAAFAADAATASIKNPGLSAALCRLGEDVTPIIGVDRLDYSKGLAERFFSFNIFLRLYPQFARRVSLIQVAPVGRSEIPAYRDEAARVNRAYVELLASHAWGDPPPAQLLTGHVDRSSLAAAFRRCPVALVTPLRDGMNLVAKEYVAAQDPGDPGVLVLSRAAGAADEFGGGAIIVDPCDPVDIAKALRLALTMDRPERRRRWAAMISVIRQNDAAHWSSSFIKALVQGAQKKHLVPLQIVAA